MVLQRWQSVYLLIAAIALGLGQERAPGRPAVAGIGCHARRIRLFHTSRAVGAAISDNHLQIQEPETSEEPLLYQYAAHNSGIYHDSSMRKFHRRHRNSKMAVGIAAPGIRINLHISRKKQNNPRRQADSRRRPPAINRRSN